MAYTNVYPTRINWENEPSINTPINDVNLNKIDYAVYEHDRTLANWDTTKANQSDLLLSVKTIDYDSDTGVFIFTWQNGTTKTVDLNIEKIPVSFSMNAQGVITMTTDDGTQYTADVGALIKTYTFNDSSVIDFTVTTDGSGNKTITADIVDGSITGTKLQPNYLADCTAAKTAAENAETGAEGSAEDAEAWAIGERGGVPVDPTDPTYHNNSKYWSEQANVTTLSALTDTDIDNPADGQVLTYDGATSKWENKTPAAGGGSKITITTSELSLIGTTATLTDGVTTLSADFDNSGKAVFEGVTMTGTLTVTATNGVDTATKQITIQYYGNYTFVIAFFSATITITFPYSNGATCSISDGDTTLTATESPMAFTIPNTGTWVATCTLDGQSKTQSFVITTDGQTESHTFEYGTINLTFDNEFRGLTVTCANGGTVISKTAPISGNTMAFYPPSTGEWIISSTYSGVPYSTSATVVSLSTAVSAILQTLPNGQTVLPTDDIQTWLKCAGINNKTSYTTLADVLGDSTTLLALMSHNNAVDYLVRSKSWTTANGLVPTLTADTSQVIGTTAEGGSGRYMVFDGVKSNYSYWAPTPMDTNAWVGYDFVNPTIVQKVGILVSSVGRILSVLIQGTNNLSGTWNTLATIDTSAYEGPAQSVTTPTYTNISNTTAYRYYRLKYNNITSYASLCELQFYTVKSGQGICDNSTAMTDIGANDYCANTLLADSTWCSAICNSTYFESVLNVKVPTMTSNTAPSGVCSGKDIMAGNYQYYFAFDGNENSQWVANSTNSYLQYEFPNPILAKRLYTYNVTNSNRPWTGTLKGSNDGATWNDTLASNINGASGARTTTDLISNTTSYKYFRLYCDSTSTLAPLVTEVQIYGR